MNKKLLAKILGVSLVLVLTAVAVSNVFARENDDDNLSVSAIKETAKELKTGATLGWGEMKKLSDYDKPEAKKGEAATVRANGDFRVNGATVNSVNASTNTINVTFFGFTRDVNVSGAKLFGGGQAITLSDIQSGDTLNAAGNYNATTKVLAIYEIQDITAKNQNILSIQARIQQLLEMIQKLQEQVKARLGQ